MVDQVGLLDGESLLHTTLVNEYLQDLGALQQVIDRTVEEGEPQPLFEAALGRPLSEFDDEWRAWLLDEALAPGLKQRLERDAAPGPSSSRSPGSPGSLVLAALLAVRDAASRISGFTTTGRSCRTSCRTAPWRTRAT